MTYIGPEQIIIALQQVVLDVAYMAPALICVLIFLARARKFLFSDPLIVATSILLPSLAATICVSFNYWNASPLSSALISVLILGIFLPLLIYRPLSAAADLKDPRFESWIFALTAFICFIQISNLIINILLSGRSWIHSFDPQARNAVPMHAPLLNLLAQALAYLPVWYVSTGVTSRVRAASVVALFFTALSVVLVGSRSGFLYIAFVFLYSFFTKQSVVPASGMRSMQIRTRTSPAVVMTVMVLTCALIFVGYNQTNLFEIGRLGVRMLSAFDLTLYILVGGTEPLPEAPTLIQVLLKPVLGGGMVGTHYDYFSQYILHMESGVSLRGVGPNDHAGTILAYNHGWPGVVVFCALLGAMCLFRNYALATDRVSFSLKLPGIFLLFSPYVLIVDVQRAFIMFTLVVIVGVSFDLLRAVFYLLCARTMTGP